MDKLTPGMIAQVLREIRHCMNGDKISQREILERLGQLDDEEAARREGEQKPEPCAFDTGEHHCKRCRRSVVTSRHKECEREGLGSAAASTKWNGSFWENERGEMAKPDDAKPAPFRLEVGKSYARRDGTGPVKIVADRGDAIWPMTDDSGNSYQSDGSIEHRGKGDPRDLVALWQAGAQAPQTDAEELHSRKCAALNYLGAACDCGGVDLPVSLTDRIEALRKAKKAWRAGAEQYKAERDALKAQLGGQNEITVKQAVQLAAEQRRVARLEDALRKNAATLEWTKMRLIEMGKATNEIETAILETRAALAGDKTND
jgi:hypothetical protein